jgi:hypothetical protein
VQAYINCKAKALSKKPLSRAQRKAPVVGDFSREWLKVKIDKEDGVSDVLKQIDGTVKMQRALLRAQYDANPQAFTDSIPDKP